MKLMSPVRVVEAPKNKRAPPDSQRQQVYEAETSTGLYAQTPDFATHQALHDWTLECLSSQLIDENWPSFIAYAPPDNGPLGQFTIGQKRKGSRWSHANLTGIYIAPTHRYRRLVCHEIAHVIADREYGWYKTASHGHQWCGIYLTLVSWFISIAEREVLRQAFIDHGVDIDGTKVQQDWQRRGIRRAA